MEKCGHRLDPIGIFDSGVGGLSVAKSIRKEMKNENLLYIADSLHAPYGNKSEQFIYQRSATMINFLLQHHAKAVVVACNTATVSVIKKLRHQFKIPIIGIEPGIRPAVAKSRKGIIGIIATEQTLKSGAFTQLKNKLAHNIEVIVQACPGLVEQVEKYELHGEKTESMLRAYLLPLLDKGVDTLVLGCTHYSFVSPLIEKIVGSDICIINTNTAVAKEVSRRLHEVNLNSLSTEPGKEQFWSSANLARINFPFCELWGYNFKVQQF